MNQIEMVPSKKIFRLVEKSREVYQTQRCVSNRISIFPRPKIGSTILSYPESYTRRIGHVFVNLRVVICFDTTPSVNLIFCAPLIRITLSY